MTCCGCVCDLYFGGGGGVMCSYQRYLYSEHVLIDLPSHTTTQVGMTLE